MSTNDFDNLKQDLAKRSNDIRQSRRELYEELMSMETWVNKSLVDTDKANIQLKNLLSRKRIAELKFVDSQPEPVSVEPTPVRQEDFTEQLEKLLQGSLDSLQDKISDKLLNMINELKTMSGSNREAKIKDIQAVANTEFVDLSSLYTHNEIESNIEEVGVEEQEVKGIDKNLAKLKQMKKGKQSKKK